MKTITVHIGNYKTGSTAIQEFIGHNRKRFLETGYYVPLAGFDGSAHHELIWSLRDEPFARSREEVYASLNAEIASCGYPDILISSEVFFNGLTAKAFRDALEGEFRLRIIAYLRRQDHFLSAFHQQMIKHWNFRKTEKPTLKQLLNVKAGHYVESLDRWAAVAGRENIVVRPYEMQQLDQGLIHDFVTVLGRNPADYEELPREKRTNETIHAELIEFLRYANAIEMSKDEHEALVSALTHLSSITKSTTFSKRSILSPQERLTILEQTAAENETIARTYLGREDGRLFHEPWPEPDEDWSPVELTQEDIVRIAVGLWLDIRQKSAGLERLAGKVTSIKAVQRLLGDRSRLLRERGELYRKLRDK
ncbi:MAG: hypothetical protein R3D65_14100 [Zhengella sp.]|uniref:hypothetical protein n=1 Tax=Zhengella sp. TaxID=2282762 RepID=UPI001D36F8C4|nr:hypothetical protein [Notoacmeibacter sp.]